MIDLPTTAVYLTEPELAKFIIFQQQQARFNMFLDNYDAISTMINAGVFTLKNGKAIVSFERTGRVADIELQYHTYRMPKPQPQAL